MQKNRWFSAGVAICMGIGVLAGGCADKTTTEATTEPVPKMGPPANPDTATTNPDPTRTVEGEKPPTKPEITFSATGVPQIKNPPTAKTIGKLKSIEGKPISIEALHGKVIILDFWATWCGPCRMTIPLLKELHEKYNSQGLVILGISDETVAQVTPFAKGMGMNYTVIADPDTSSTWQLNYEVESLPSMVVIDRNGKVRMYEKGLDMRKGTGTHDRLNEIIPQLLAEK